MENNNSSLREIYRKNLSRILNCDENNILNLSAWSMYPKQKYKNTDTVPVICRYLFQDEEREAILFSPYGKLNNAIEEHRKKKLKTLREVISLLSKKWDNQFVLVGSDASQLMYDGKLKETIEGDFDLLFNTENLEYTKKEMEKQLKQEDYLRNKDNERRKNVRNKYDFFTFQKENVEFDVYFGLPPFYLTEGTKNRVQKIKIDGCKIPLLSIPDSIISFCGRSQNKINEPTHKRFLKLSFAQTPEQELLSLLEEHQQISIHDIIDLYKRVNSYRYKTAVVGGTFSSLHEGNKAVLERAFEIGNRVIIGVTSDEKSKRQNIPSFDERIKSLINYLDSEEILNRVEIIKIDDIQRILLENNYKDVDGILVSSRNYRNALKINRFREKKNWEKSDIIIIDYLLEDTPTN